MSLTKNQWALLSISGTLFLSAAGFWPKTSTAMELRAAFSPECPTTPFPRGTAQAESTILTAIATTLASSLVDTGIAALKKTVNPGNATLESQFLEQGLYVFRTADAAGPVSSSSSAATAPVGAASGEWKGIVEPASKLGCLVVAAGTFTVSENGVQGWQLPFKSEREEPDQEGLTSANWRVGKALNLNGPASLAIYLEAARVFSGDKSAVTWKPVRLYIGEYLNDGFWSGKSRSTAIEMRLYKPGKKEAFFSQEFPFAAVTKPLSRGSKDLGEVNAGSWGALPAASIVPAKFEPNKDGRLFDPFTLEVRVVEAPKPYALAIAFADAVEKNKEAINKEVTQAIDSKAKATAEMTAEGATLEAISSYLTTLKTVATDCTPDKLKEELGKLSCSISRDRATVAKQKADLACKANSVASCNTLPTIPAVTG